MDISPASKGAEGRRCGLLRICVKGSRVTRFIDSLLRETLLTLLCFKSCGISPFVLMGRSGQLAFLSALCGLIVSKIMNSGK